MLKTGRREVPGSNPGRTCQPSRSEFSVVFSETLVNTGSYPVERLTRRARPYRPRSHKRTIGLQPTTNLNFIYLSRLRVTILFQIECTGKCSGSLYFAIMSRGHELNIYLIVKFKSLKVQFCKNYKK